jgi:hypothetical protein
MSLFHLEIDDLPLVGQLPGNFEGEGGGRPILAYTFSFKSSQHEMYTMDDVFSG